MKSGRGQRSHFDATMGFLGGRQRGMESKTSESGNPPHVTTSATSRRVLGEQVRLLYRPASPLIVNAVNAAIVSAVLWPEFGTPVLVWAGLIAIVVAGRFILRRNYMEAADRQNGPLWARRQAIGAALTGLLWGATAAVIALPVSPAYHLFVALTILGMSAGAVAALSFHLPSFVAFVVPCVAPTAVVLLAKGDAVYAGLGALGVVFLLGLVGLARSFNATLTETLRLRFENADLARDLREAQDIAEAASRSSSEILAHLSHELRTPLNAVAGFAEVMRTQVFGPLGHQKYEGYAKDIAGSAQHLIALVDDILRYAKGYIGSLAVEESELDVQVEIEGCLRMVAESAQAAGVDLVRDIAPDLPLLHGDGVKLRQIVVNLLSNAIKFTPPGGRVTMSATVDAQGGLTMVVADTGIGIAADDLHRVMQPYVRLENAMTQTRSGLGLGLPLAKRLAEMQGGTLSLSSTPGIGTRVTVTFPAGRSVPRRAPSP
jgi:signal transduction histidine kinase